MSNTMKLSMPNKISNSRACIPKRHIRKRQFCITENNSTQFAYKDHCYHVYKPKTKVFIKKAVNTIISDYEIMLSHYSRVLVTRIDLHPSTYSVDNQVIKQFIEQLTNLLNSEYQSKVVYHCAREQSTSDIEHYHLEVMLSAHKIKHPSRLLTLIKAMWKMHTNGTVSYVDNPFCIVKRGDKSSLKEAIYRSSYLAKEDTKELNDKNKGFLSNKLPPAKNFDPSNDLMLVDPYITFEQNRRKQAFLANSTDIKLNKALYGWFNTQSVAQQLKECIANRTSSLNFLTGTSPLEDKPLYRYKDNLITCIRKEVITQPALHEP